MSTGLRARPRGITALIIFFSAGAVISSIAAASLLIPTGVFELMWRVNPRGHEGLLRLGWWGAALLFVASIACAAAALGLWRRTRWGLVIAIALIVINLVSDVLNAVSGDARVLVGVPIALLMLLYLLSKNVRKFFNAPPLEN